MDKEEQKDKAISPPCEVVEQNVSDSLQGETKFSFSHSTKLKFDSMLHVHSWIYNELMGLKKKMEIMQHNQELDRVKISQMEVQMGDIPNKLKDYEQNLWMLIKESGTKMEQVTSSICVATASLDKWENEEIISTRGSKQENKLEFEEEISRGCCCFGY